MPLGKGVLVFRTGHLGDMVCSIPAFRLIRSYFAEAELTLVCDQPHHGVKVPAVEVVQNLGIFDRIVTYRSNQGLCSIWHLLHAVRKVRPDLAIILPQVRETVQSFRRKRQFFRFCGVPDIRGSLTPIFQHAWNPSEADRLVDILNRIGISGVKPAYAIPSDPVSRSSVDEKLRSVGLQSRQPFIVFCGGGKEATQRWPLDRYAAALACLAKETDSEVLGIGNAQEIENYRTQVLPTFACLRLVPRQFTASEIFELCRRAMVYFGNDTGPMHVAAAAGCPVAVVMSARNAPGMWDPDVEPRLIIRNRTECENCFLSDCIVERHRCLAEISVDRVTAELIPFIKSVSSL